MIGVGGNWGTQFYMVLEALKHFGADKDVQLVSTGDVANGYLSLQQGSMPAVALTPPTAFWRSARAIGIWSDR